MERLRSLIKSLWFSEARRSFSTRPDVFDVRALRGSWCIKENPEHPLKVRNWPSRRGLLPLAEVRLS
jgi:hypothetical protein